MARYRRITFTVEAFQWPIPSDQYREPRRGKVVFR